MDFSKRAGSKYHDMGLVTDYQFSIDEFIKDTDWHTKSLASVIGKGTKLVSISVGCKIDVAARQVVFRTCGQDGTKNFASLFTSEANRQTEHTLWVLTDKDGKIDYFITAGTWANFQFCIRGYFE